MDSACETCAYFRTGTEFLPIAKGTSTGQARLAAESGNGRIHRSEDARHGGPRSKLREQLRRISWIMVGRGARS